MILQAHLCNPFTRHHIPYFVLVLNWIDTLFPKYDCCGMLSISFMHNILANITYFINKVFMCLRIDCLHETNDNMVLICKTKIFWNNVWSENILFMAKVPYIYKLKIVEDSFNIASKIMRHRNCYQQLYDIYNFYFIAN
jgi:hypothetical protein